MTKETMSAAQREHLQGRLNAAERALLEAIPQSKWRIEEPVEVKRARLLVKQWDAHHYSREHARKDKTQNPIKRAAEKVRTAILFRGPVDALAVVEAFERRARQVAR